MAMFEPPARRAFEAAARGVSQSPGSRTVAGLLLLALVLLMGFGWGVALAAIAGALIGQSLMAWSPSASAASTSAPVLDVVSAAVVTTASHTAPATAPTPASAVVPASPPVTLAWRSLIDALPDPAIALGSDLLVVYANRTAHRLFPAMQQGASIALVSRAPELGEALDQVLKSRGPRSVVIQDRIPVERRLDVAMAPLPSSGPQEPTLLLVLHDVSERDRLAQMRSDFIAHASHELRTPLASLRGFIETLQGPARDDAAARERFLGIMGLEAQRMTRLLDDLLSLSRVEMRAHLAPTGTVDVGETLTAVGQMLQPVAAAANVRLRLVYSGPPRIIRGDRDEIVQVFVNLIQNAIKYGRKDGTVTVSVVDAMASRRRRVRIAVVDDGPGIAEEHIPRLTERFYRVDDKSSREKGGTGLGLAIVKHILNRHEGRLEIQSTLGVGSSFIVDLPLVEA